MAGKRITMAEIFARKAAEAKAFHESPEGKAQAQRVAEKFARERAAQEAYAAANPRGPFEDGQDAALSNDEREPPSDLDDEARQAWLDGYDAEAGEREDGAE